jgi:hypothetical protein
MGGSYADNAMLDVLYDKKINIHRFHGVCRNHADRCLTER